MTLWVPADETIHRGYLFAPDDFEADPKSWRRSTRFERVWWEVTYARVSLADFVAFIVLFLIVDSLFRLAGW